MENAIIQRIRCLVDDSPLSLTALCRKMGISQSTLYRQLSGERPLSLSTVQSFLDYFPEVSSEWLMRGRGDAVSFPAHDGQNMVIGSHNAGNNVAGVPESLVRSLLEEKDKQISRLLDIVSRAGLK